ncbi:hypothetical protein [Persicitalea sp.]|uniref:hypothetical protein n=1 Tax=Persicitalea sp. TaxID=3100273 RepID=UPI003593824A
MTYSQADLFKSKSGKAHLNSKISAYFLFNGGWGITSSFGTWIRFKHTQPSFNISLNMVGSESNLGNRNRYLTTYQINAVMSPMIMVGAGDGLFQEVNPFYFGASSAIHSDFKQSITIGSNFVVMPRGVGRNITTFRNRTQQLVYIGLRGGGSDWDINFNIYEDFFGTDNGILQGLADNYDRFYTGGGNLQLRFKNIKVKLFSEIYTGNFQRDLFDSPDLYEPFKPNTSRVPNNFIEPSGVKPDSKAFKKRTRHPRYVSQEPGQKLFNTGRTFLAIELSPELFGQGKTRFNNASMEGFIGFQGGIKQMGVQNLIHSWSTISKINLNAIPNEEEPDDLHNKKSSRERLHRFYPAYEESILIGGVGSSYNLLR